MKYSTCWNDVINTFIAIAIIHPCAPLATGSNLEQLCLVATVMTVEKKLLLLPALLLHIHICRCECHWSCTPTTIASLGSDICSLQLILFSRPICAPLSDARLPSYWKESDTCNNCNVRHFDHEGLRQVQKMKTLVVETSYIANIALVLLRERSPSLLLIWSRSHEPLRH